MRYLYEGRGSQARILIVLAENGSITQKELTERLGIQPGSASEVLMKLENNGLIARTASKSDRRTTEVSLTEEGMRKAEEAAKTRALRHEEMFSCLSPDEKDILVRLLEKINQDWEVRYRDRQKHHNHGGHRNHP
ncbi:MAG: MarR family transcriptional regulator [Lachnospiraceae bacterium]|nr:MarR family transcriptional regulator [Lachnospiraceae bacterium]